MNLFYLMTKIISHGTCALRCPCMLSIWFDPWKHLNIGSFIHRNFALSFIVIFSIRSLHNPTMSNVFISSSFSFLSAIFPHELAYVSFDVSKSLSMITETSLLNWSDNLVDPCFSIIDNWAELSSDSILLYEQSKVLDSR